MNDNEIKKQMIVARDEYIDLVKSELLGPGSEFSTPDAEHELISSDPTSRYSIGILYPQGNQVNQDSDETVPIDTEEAEKTFEVIDIQEQDGEPQTDKKSLGFRFLEFDETAD